MNKRTLVRGVTYHGSTVERLRDLDNFRGKHISAEYLRRHIVWFLRRYHIVEL